jgi:hypothetical protein
MNFEEFVYKYDEPVRKNESFVGMTSYCGKFQFFNPKKNQ